MDFEDYGLGEEDRAPINEIVDTHSVEFLKGYQQAIVEMAHVKVREVINDATDDLVSAELLDPDWL